MYIKDVYLYLMITVSSSDIAKILLKVALNIHPNRGQSFKHVLIFIDKGYENVSMIIVLSVLLRYTDSDYLFGIFKLVVVEILYYYLSHQWLPVRRMVTKELS